MSESWKTKWGARRVRHDPPTLAEAFAAAACLTGDRQQQAEIAADLMGVSLADALVEAGRLVRDERATITVATPSRDKLRVRTVVIERRPARRALSGGKSQDFAAAREAGAMASGAKTNASPSSRLSTGLRSR